MLNTVFPQEEIVEYCKLQIPNESCGIVILFKGRYRFIPTKNISTNPTEEFSIAPEEYADAEDLGEIVAIVHSHPTSSATPSSYDLFCQKQHGIDWLIIGLGNDAVDTQWIKTEKQNTPLYGREYKWHVQDCGSFIQDFYKQEFNIGLPDFYRPEKFWEQGLEIYLEAYEKAGFYEIPMMELKYGDVILFALGTTITTHGAVYVGDNNIAHHLNDRLSCREILGKFYLDRATRYLRHKDMKNG